MQDAKRSAKAKFKISCRRVRKTQSVMQKTKFKICTAVPILAVTMRSNPIWGPLNLAKFRALSNQNFLRELINSVKFYAFLEAQIASEAHFISVHGYTKNVLKA